MTPSSSAGGNTSSLVVNEMRTRLVRPAICEASTSSAIGFSGDGATKRRAIAGVRVAAQTCGALTSVRSFPELQREVVVLHFSPHGQSASAAQAIWIASLFAGGCNCKTHPGRSKSAAWTRIEQECHELNRCAYEDLAVK